VSSGGLEPIFASSRERRKGVMRRVAAGFIVRRSFQIGPLLTVLLGLFSVLMGAEAVSAFSFDEAIERCRQTVGRPIVKACMWSRRWDVTGQSGGADINACKAWATPRVRACVRTAMIAAYGRAKVEQTIEHCRQTLGRPIVKACMSGGHYGVRGANRAAYLEACRARATPQVRACVRRRLSSAHGLSAPS
jgi:hypothetical protein